VLEHADFPRQPDSLARWAVQIRPARRWSGRLVTPRPAGRTPRHLGLVQCDYEASCREQTGGSLGRANDRAGGGAPDEHVCPP